jgi:hypothetical protein
MSPLFPLDIDRSKQQKSPACGEAFLRDFVSLLLERSSGCSDEGLEAFSVSDGDLREHLTVDIDTSLGEAFDKARIVRNLRISETADSGIDTSNPELAVFAFAKLTVPGGEALGAIDGLSGQAELFAACAVKTTSEFQAATTTFTGSGCISSSHFLFLLSD